MMFRGRTCNGTLRSALMILAACAFSFGLPSRALAQTKTFSSIEQMSGWSSCNACAGISGSGAKATYWYKQNIASPVISGKSMQFFIGGSNPYADVIWWREMGANNAATHFQYDVYFYLKTPQYAEALEFDVNQNVNGRRFVFGTQCAVKTPHHSWDVWDTAGNAWRSTGVPCPTPSAYKWHHLTWEIYRDSKYTHFVAFTIDGVKHYVNRAYSSKATSNGNAVSVAFQMDGDYAMHDYSTWLDKVSLKEW